MKEKFFETHVGADATVYVRFLRGVCESFSFLSTLLGAERSEVAENTTF